MPKSEPGIMVCSTLSGWLAFVAISESWKAGKTTIYNLSPRATRADKRQLVRPSYVEVGHDASEPFLGS